MVEPNPGFARSQYLLATAGRRVIWPTLLLPTLLPYSWPYCRPGCTVLRGGGVALCIKCHGL